jgi:phosphoglycerol transferase MdoB-like AlkP superfamily enzyme
MKKISNIIITIMSIILLIAAFIFQCPQKDDGSYMHCHNANIALAVISCVIIVLGIISFVSKNTIAKYVLSAVVAVASVLGAMIPGIIVSLCMMPEMTCRAALRPTAIICSVIICIFAIVSLIFEKKASA